MTPPGIRSSCSSRDGSDALTSVTRIAAAEILALGLVLVALRLLTAGVAFAAVGLAEWEITTPGGHRISHIDPLKASQGTCLRRADRQPGIIEQRADDIFVSHLEWWMYYSGVVVGQARDGFFLFDEAGASVERVPTEARLRERIAQRHLGQPQSKRMTPEDGWNEAWMPLLRQRCAALTAGGADVGDASAREAITKYCAKLNSP